MDKIAGILLISLLAIVMAVSLSYYVVSQPSQTSNTPIPTSTPAASPTPTSTPFPSETPTGSVSVPKPSVPEFTLEFDTSTSLVLRIKNQPLSSYHNDSNAFYYSIRFKVDSSEVRKYWTTLYFGRYEYWKTPSDSEYTVIPVGYYGVDPYGQDCFIVSTNEEQKIYLPYPDQVDFQVEALIGYIAPATAPPVFSYTIVGETSGWSETQTITIP